MEEAIHGTIFLLELPLEMLEKDNIKNSKQHFGLGAFQLHAAA